MWDRMIQSGGSFSSSPPWKRKQITERIIGHECISVSQQAASSWASLLTWAPNIGSLWEKKKQKNGQLAKLLFALTFSLKATFQKKHDKMPSPPEKKPFNPRCSSERRVRSVWLPRVTHTFPVIAISPHITPLTTERGSLMLVINSSETKKIRRLISETEFKKQQDVLSLSHPAGRWRPRRWGETREGIKISSYVERVV